MKGRDWYDFVWYIARKIPVNLTHLQERLIQSKAWSQERLFTKEELLRLLNEKIQKTDFDNAQKDILPFVRDPQSIELWSKEFFLELLSQLITNEGQIK